MFKTAQIHLRQSVRRYSRGLLLCNKQTADPTLPVFQYPVSKPGDRRVYVWGLVEHGATGLLSSKRTKDGCRYVSKPTRLTFGERHTVRNVACGYGFTVFAVNSNDKNILYGSGINTDSQLGYHISDKKYKNGVITEPRPINLPIQSATTKVLDIAGGRAHLLVLTDEGVFTLGNNAYGQCGRPIIENEDYASSRVVHYIKDVKGKKITAVTAGQDHSILLTENGEVYTFGWGADGQTGLAHYQNEYRPGLVKGDLAGQRIVKVSSVCDCVLAVSEKGKVFGWGNTEYGQLPITTDTHQVNIATELKINNIVGHVIDVAAGGSFCMVLNNVGEVYVWGYGILGLGPQVDNVSKPTLVPPVLFGRNEFEKKVKIIKISAGMSHLAAINNLGDLYTWGCNKFGCLGLRHLDCQYFPLKVCIGAQPEIVACGIDHTITLCKPFV